MPNDFAIERRPKSGDTVDSPGLTEDLSQNELLNEILRELKLLNMRFEEAFETEFTEDDIDG